MTDREYITCLHCGGKLANRARQTCSALCKSALFKSMRKQRRDAARRPAEQWPALNLTDAECAALEAAVGRLDGMRSRQRETSRRRRHMQLESVTWASKGAELDIAEIRRKDRMRHGGVTDALTVQREFTRLSNTPKAKPLNHVPLFISDLENAMTCIDVPRDINRRANVLTLRANLILLENIVALLEKGLAAL